MTLPPYARTLGITAERDEDGRLILLLPFAETLVGRPGFLHGGAIAGLLEMAALLTLKEEPVVSHIRPITVTVDFMRGGRPRETRAAATILRAGTRIANVEARAWQEDEDRPIAIARTNLMLERG